MDKLNKKFTKAYLNMFSEDIEADNSFNGIQNNIMEPEPIKYEETEITDHLNAIKEYLTNLETQINEWDSYMANDKKMQLNNYDDIYVKDTKQNDIEALNAINDIKQKINDISSSIAVLTDIFNKQDM